MGPGCIGLQNAVYSKDGHLVLALHISLSLFPVGVITSGSIQLHYACCVRDEYPCSWRGPQIYLMMSVGSYSCHIPSLCPRKRG